MIIGPDTTRCDACGRRYEFTSHKDRCPICCPKDEPVEEPDYFDQDEWDDSGFTPDESDETQQAAAE